MMRSFGCWDGGIPLHRQSRQFFLRGKWDFDNISLDLMSTGRSRPEQDFMQSVQALLELEPAHLSCYSLKLEAGTRMAEQNPRLPDGDVQADSVSLHLCDRLDKAGYQHYEISNWAKPNRESRHNSRYWKLSDYLGLGPGAHSCIAGKRFAYPDDLQEFCNAPKRDRGGTGFRISTVCRIYYAVPAHTGRHFCQRI